MRYIQENTQQDENPGVLGDAVLDRRCASEVFDAIVVGSGPGGATIARELSRRKKKVLILERGGNGPLSDGFWTSAAILNSVAVSDELSAVSAFTTGGTTALYFGVADFPPLDDFMELGIDLSMSFQEAQAELPLAQVPDELLGPQVLRVRESAMELGQSWEKRTMLVDQSKCGNGYSYEAKWSARAYLREAVREGAALICRATVIKVIVEKDRAIGVEYRLRRRKGGQALRQAYGKKMILASGALASPVILRNSGLTDIGNHGFYCIPSFAVLGTVKDLKATNCFAGSMGTRLEDGIVFGDGSVPSPLYRMIMLSERRFLRILAHANTVGVGVMVRDELGGKLDENGRYYKEVSEEEAKKLVHGEKVARRIVKNAGGKNLFRAGLGAAHVGGVIRIRKDLDEILQTKYRNLHVCDGSVMPETARVSPTLTLICLGKYLASQIADQI